MTSRTIRNQLKVQLLETQRMLMLAGNHPLMSVAFANREREIKQRLDALPVGGKEAKVILLFSGEPVQGSQGIDSSFAGRVLEPFQNMVMADYAERHHGVVGSRGKRTGEGKSRLLLTGLPRGSFGFELSRADNDELFEEEHLADTLLHVTRLVESAALSDEDFAVELDRTAPRVIQNLKDFLTVISKGKAGMKLETGDASCVMSPNQAAEAHNRVANTLTTSEEIEEHGIFKGVLLESWRYDFINDDGFSMGGKIDDNLTEEEIIQMNQQFFNKQCVAKLLKTTVLFKNGRVRTSYSLLSLSNR